MWWQSSSSRNQPHARHSIFICFFFRSCTVYFVIVIVIFFLSLVAFDGTEENEMRLQWSSLSPGIGIMWKCELFIFFFFFFFLICFVVAFFQCFSVEKVKCDVRYEREPVEWCQCELAIMKTCYCEIILVFIHQRIQSIHFGVIFDALRSLVYFNVCRFTWSERSPAVGVWSLGSDSGMSPNGSFVCIPGHPTHRPFPLITTGHTAVTNPPALISIGAKNKTKIKSCYTN